MQRSSTASLDFDCEDQDHVRGGESKQGRAEQSSAQAAHCLSSRYAEVQTLRPSIGCSGSQEREARTGRRSRRERAAQQC